MVEDSILLAALDDPKKFIGKRQETLAAFSVSCVEFAYGILTAIGTNFSIADFAANPIFPGMVRNLSTQFYKEVLSVIDPILESAKQKAEHKMENIITKV